MNKKKLGLSGGLGKFREEKKQLVVLPELKSYIPPLSEEEEELLIESIKNDGIREPLDIWHNGEDDIIVDGHNRYRIAQKLGLSYKTKEHNFNTIEDVKEWMLKKQLGRRNLTDANRSYLIGLLYNNSKDTKGGDRRSQIIKDVDTSGAPTKTTAKQIAEQTGMSERSVKSAGEFAIGIEELSPELKSDVLKGKEKISKADIQQLSKQKPEEKILNKEDLSIHLQQNTPKNKVANKTKETATRKKILKLLNEVGEEIFISLLNEIIPIRSKLPSSLEKLVNDDYRIIRKINSPIKSIEIIDKNGMEWQLVNKEFTDHVDRDQYFNQLLIEPKVIEV